VTLRWLIQTGLGDPRRGVEANTGATPGQQNVRKQPQTRSRSTSPKPRIGAHTATSGNYPQARELIAMQKVVGSNPISRFPHSQAVIAGLRYSGAGGQSP
jgi:hypothetical protein